MPYLTTTLSPAKLSQMLALSPMEQTNGIDGLAPNSQASNQGPIVVWVALDNVTEQTLALPNHLQKPPARRVILRIILKMGRELINPRRQHGDLDIGRSGIGLMDLILGKNFLLTLLQ